MFRLHTVCSILVLTFLASCGGRQQSLPTGETSPPEANKVMEAKEVAEIACKRLHERDDHVYLTAQQFETRYGASAEKFAEVQSTLERPVEVCGVDLELEFLTRLRCADGSNPYGDLRSDPYGALLATLDSRRGSFGPGGRCGSIIDLYDVPCPEKTYEVYIDFYICPLWQRYIAAGDEARDQNNYPEAEKQFAAALKDAEGLGPDHPCVAASLNSLAYVYRVVGFF